MEPLISVVLPVYNAENYLRRCIDSVLNNTYKNLELVIVDDGSVDKSSNICDEYSAKDNRVKLVHKSNEGTAKARNLGISIANGKYIAFIDNDDFIHPRFYEYMIKALETTDADVVVCELTRDLPTNTFNKDIKNEPKVVNKHSFILGTYTGNWTRNTAPWNKLYKRELFDDICFPPNKGYEDAYTTYKLLWDAKRIAYLNSTLYYWYNNKDSYSTKKDNAEKLLFREEAIRYQSEFYTDSDYSDVSNAARVFFLQQLVEMIWQLDNWYEQIDSTKKVRNRFLRLARKEYKINKSLLTDNERIRIFDYLFPIRSTLAHKCIKFSSTP